ncbi:MAG: DUF3782 domain-containing protein [Promethearchaeota archaeon]
MKAGFREVDKRFGQVDKRFEQIEETLVDLKQGMKNLNERTDKNYLELKAITESLGCRSGESLEIVILKFMKDILERHGIDYKKLRNYKLVDKDGRVFSKNYVTDIDILESNGDVLLYEIKYHPSNRDIFHFLKTGELYNLIEDKKFNNQFNFMKVLLLLN